MLTKTNIVKQKSFEEPKQFGCCLLEYCQGNRHCVSRWNKILNEMKKGNVFFVCKKSHYLHLFRFFWFVANTLN